MRSDQRRYLLDTHVMYWVLREPEEIGQKVHRLLSDPKHELLVSIVSLWEIAIKTSIGKMSRAPADLLALLQREYTILPITLSHITAVQALPLIHRDPFDRMLVAQAQVEQVTLLTRDSEIMRYDVKALLA